MFALLQPKPGQLFSSRKQGCPVGPVWLPCRGPQPLQPGSSRHDMSCRTRSAAAPALTPESSLQGRSAPLTVAFSVPFSI